jgi:Zn-dependent protease
VKTILFLLATGKLWKLLISAGSMIISVVTYSFIYGWRYAVGFVGLLFLHELGHYRAAQLRNLPVGLPTFIPFLGAWIELKEQPLDAETEAFVAIAGPMLGSFGAFVLYLISFSQEANIFTALAYSGFMLNLFNLIPISPLDGGRIVSIISPKIWFLGMPILLILFYFNQSPILLVIAILALPNLWNAYKNRNEPESDYYKSSLRLRTQYGVQYISLIIFLTILSLETHTKLNLIHATSN